MRILITGASSFTGYWFTNCLTDAGHDVVATFTRPNLGSYGDDVRGRRVRQLTDRCRAVFNCRFGDSTFLDLVSSERLDRLCHHAAYATDYKSPTFDVVHAVAENTYRVCEVLALLAKQCASLVITQSVFAGGEGDGSDGLPHFSPYGLSKALTCQVLNYYAYQNQVPLGTFVIPNPFGPFEEPRFTNYLMRTWLEGQVAIVRTPEYVRDNIHVSLLASVYERFVASCRSGVTKLCPSGYVESQGEFAQRVAREMRTRIDAACEVEMMDQREYGEPRSRFNTDWIDWKEIDWHEEVAWNEFAQFYLQLVRVQPVNL